MSENNINYENPNHMVSRWAKVFFIVLVLVVSIGASVIVIKYVTSDNISPSGEVMKNATQTEDAVADDNLEEEQVDLDEFFDAQVEPTPEFVNPKDVPALGGALLAAANGDISVIVKNVGDSVVGIDNLGSFDDFKGGTEEATQGYGSGVIITEDGYIVTNYHVINNSSSIIVTLPNDEETVAALVGVYPDMDLAVLKIEADNLTVMPIGDSNNIILGELVIAIGNPLGPDYGGSVTAGIISGIDREVTVDGKTNAFIQTDAAINPGNSGGALVNSRGELVGITSVKTASIDVEGMGFAIPISDALPIIEQLILEGFIERPILGITGSIITEAQADYYKIPIGFMVSSLIEDGAADEAGILKGDIIIKVDEQEITDTALLSKIISEDNRIGDNIAVTVWRDGEELTYGATLMSNRIE